MFPRNVVHLYQTPRCHFRRRSALWCAAWSMATKTCAEILTVRMDMEPTAFTASLCTLPQAIVQFRWQQQALLAQW